MARLHFIAAVVILEAEQLRLMRIRSGLYCVWTMPCHERGSSPVYQEAMTIKHKQGTRASQVTG